MVIFLINCFYSNPVQASEAMIKLDSTSILVAADWPAIPGNCTWRWLQRYLDTNFLIVLYKVPTSSETSDFFVMVFVAKSIDTARQFNATIRLVNWTTEITWTGHPSSIGNGNVQQIANEWNCFCFNDKVMRLYALDGVLRFVVKIAKA